MARTVCADIIDVRGILPRRDHGVAHRLAQSENLVIAEIVAVGCVADDLAIRRRAAGKRRFVVFKDQQSRAF